MNVIIVHGSNPRDKFRLNSPEYIPQNKKNWIPWLKEKLEEKNIKVDAPLMPESWNPKYENWKNEFKKLEINDKSILVGLSAGSAFLLRYLSETNIKIKKLVLVACAFLMGEGSEFLREFYNFKLDKDLEKRIGNIIVFATNNDRPQFLEGAKIIRDKFGAELIELKDKGHFTEKHMGTKEFPELLEKVLE